MKVMSLPFSLFMWNILDEAYLKFQWKFLARDWREKKILAREHEQQQQQQVVIIRTWRQIQTKKSNQILHKLLSACVNSVRRKETAHGLDYKANLPKNSI